MIHALVILSVLLLLSVSASIFWFVAARLNEKDTFAAWDKVREKAMELQKTRDEVERLDDEVLKLRGLLEEEKELSGELAAALLNMEEERAGVDSVADGLYDALLAIRDAADEVLDAIDVECDADCCPQCCDCIDELDHDDEYEDITDDCDCLCDDCVAAERE